MNINEIKMFTLELVSTRLGYKDYRDVYIIFS